MKKGRFKMKVVAAIVIALFLLSTLNVAFIAPAAASDSGLVGYWSFNEGSGSVAYDSSGNGNNGNIYGATWVDGKYGKALSFDGANDIVQIDDSASLKLQSAGTIEFWFKPGAGFGGYDAFVLKGAAGGSGGYTDLDYGVNRDTSGAIKGWISDHSGFDIIYTRTRLWNVNQWYHIAFTWNGSYLNIYVNGESDATPVKQTRNAYVSSYPVTIGRIRDYYYNGVLDEVRIWNQALVPVKFTQTGLDGTAMGTVVTVTDTIALEYSQLPHVVCVASGSTIDYDYAAIVESSETGKYFALTNVNPSEPSTVVSAPMTVTGTYIVQHYPNANAGGPYAGTEGSPITFDASDSTDPDGDTLKYRWDFDNDGTWDTEYSTDATAQYTWLDDYAGEVKVGVRDGFVETTANTTVMVNNVVPTVNAGSDKTSNEGSPVSFSGSYSDPGVNDFPLTIEWDFGDGAKASGTLTPTHTYIDSGVYTVTLTVTDKDDGVGTDTLTVTVSNVAPTITSVTCPLDPIKIGTPVDFMVQWADPGLMDTQTIVWSWGDGSSTSINIETGGDGSSTTQHTYLSPGVYVVSVTVTDKDGGSDSKTCEYYIVVYDPNAGFVTGGGWIWSPAGAYAADPTLTGKATFGFVSKYQKGATVPTGNTEFQFQAAGMNFKSTSYQWLVIAGTKAMYKGSGTINGEGSYGFLLSAIDGGTKRADTFRIKIWDTATGNVVYDNMLGAADNADPTTVIAGGSIVVHSK